MTKAILRPTLLAIAFIVTSLVLSAALKAQALLPSDTQFAKCALHGRVLKSKHFTYCVDFASATWRPNESSDALQEREIYNQLRYERLLDLVTVITTADRIDENISKISYLSKDVESLKTSINRLCRANDCKSAKFLGFPKGMRKDPDALISFIAIMGSISFDAQKNDAVDVGYPARIQAMEHAIDLVLHPDLASSDQADHIASR